MVFRVVTWIITVIIGAVRALCPRCARAVPALCENAPLVSSKVLSVSGGVWPTQMLTFSDLQQNFGPPSSTIQRSLAWGCPEAPQPLVFGHAGVYGRVWLQYPRRPSFAVQQSTREGDLPP